MMNKSVVGFCKRLYEAVEAQYGTQAADEICGEGVPSSAERARKGKWAAETMGRLEARFGEKERKALLACCACGPRPVELASYANLYKKSASLEEYAEKRNEAWKGAARMEARDGLLYISYPRCYCGMVNQSPAPVPKTWCLCSCEYTRKSVAAAVGGPVEVKLLKSVIGGDDECLFEVRIL